jgi:UDP-2,4-diacetamido-2,4,6-trideoxy-beta-L-altropyranose hydrolase
MTIFRVDFGEKVGLGHLKRSLVYAKNFDDVVYISKSKTNLTPYRFITIKDEKEFFSYVKKLQPKEVVVDNYEFNLNHQKRFKTLFPHIKLSIFDDEYKEYICDEIINHNLGATKARYKDAKKVKIIPPLIRDEFKKEKKRRYKKEGIFISFGGVDTKGLTLKIIKALPNKKLNIYVTSQNRHIKLLKLYARRKNISLHVDEDVAKGMVKSCFGIITPSVISYEALFMQLPFIAIKTATNQKEVASFLKYKRKIKVLNA